MFSIKKSGVILILVLLLGGCVSRHIPPYMVSINNIYSTRICTGAALSNYEVLTAYHCIYKDRLNRVVTTSNIEYGFKVAYVDVRRDIAILHTTAPMLLFQYATLAPPRKGFGNLFGLCPYHFPTSLLVKYIDRTVEAVYTGGQELEYAYDQWEGYQGRRGCGGDSGGFILQGGSIVGVTSAVASDEFFVVIGRDIFTIPYDDFSEVVNASRRQ